MLCYTTAQDWPLRWADEFTNPVLDLDKWGYSIGNACDLGFCGWGNNEQQVLLTTIQTLVYYK
jgi:hypothetical protein